MSDRPIFFITDYGLEDEYVGAVKAVILSINPKARIIDITHNVPSFDIYACAFIIEKILKFLPDSSVVLGVVDPGVGGKRKPICGRTRISFDFDGLQFVKTVYFVGPDNGIFSPLFRGDFEVFVLDYEKIKGKAKDLGVLLPLSSTFHGRDIFGPASAFISSGVDFSEIASHRLVNPHILSFPVLKLKDSDSLRQIEGSVIHIDKFGNIITDIPKDCFSGYRLKALYLRGKKIPGKILSSYEQAKAGQTLFIFGSYNTLEISVREGNAQKRFRAKRFDRVKVVLEKISE